MEKRTVIQIKVGFFILLSGVVLAFILFQISGSSILSKQGYTIKAIFGFASGIEPTAPVRLAGVSVGEVSDIRIFYNEEKNKVEVELTLNIRPNIRIPRNSQTYINTLGIMGEKYVELVPGSKASGLLKAGDVLRGKDPISIERLTEVLMDVVGDKTMTNSLRETILNLNQASENFKDTSITINSIAKNLEGGQGTVGKLLTSDKMYNDLEYLIDDVRRHPWKLFFKQKEKKKNLKK
ncbi:MAG: MlaD family protein [Candidatus Omnitrophota bacterium]